MHEEMLTPFYKAKAAVLTSSPRKESYVFTQLLFPGKLREQSLAVWMAER